MTNHIQTSLYDKSKESRNVNEDSDIYKILRYPCSSNTQSCTPYVVTLSRGLYRIELFGASGGYPNNDPNLAGRGSYTSGHLIVRHEMKLYVYLGQQGTLNGQRTFNGGGRGNSRAGSGGGSSDIRLVAGEWDDFESLKSRIMVAAGGVGGHLTFAYFTGTHGGNLTGFNGISMIENCDYLGHITEAIGATQERGGISGKGDVETAEDGKFGWAGNPFSSDKVYTSGGSGVILEVQEVL